MSERIRIHWYSNGVNHTAKCECGWESQIHGMEIDREQEVNEHIQAAHLCRKSHD